MRRPQGGGSSSSSSSRSSRPRGVRQLVSGHLYGVELFDPRLLLSQLLLLLSCFYLLLAATSFGALTLLQQRQLSLHQAPHADLLLLEQQEQQQADPSLQQPDSAAAAPHALAARQVSLLFSSGSKETPKETAAALDAAMLITGAALSVLVYWVVRRSRKVFDFCFSLGLLHVLACTLVSQFPTRSGFWVSLLSSCSLCGAVAFCLCRRAESEAIVFSVSTSEASPAAKERAATGTEMQQLQQQEQQMLLVA